MVRLSQTRQTPSPHLNEHIQHTNPRRLSLPAVVEARNSPSHRRTHLSSRTTSPWSIRKRMKCWERRSECRSLKRFPVLPHPRPFWKTLRQSMSRRRVWMRTGFRKTSDEDLVMFHPKPQGGSIRNWVRHGSERGDRLCCRRHRCPDWAPCHRAHPRGCWGRWGRSGRNYNELRRTYIHTRPDLVWHLNPRPQFHEKPETGIRVVGRHVSVPVERMVRSHAVACHRGVDIHEPIRRLDITDTSGEPDTREIGCANLIARR